jgi:hypothetical protein
VSLKPYQRLQHYWADTNAGVPTVTLDESDATTLEAKYGIRLPAEFREYLLRSCPGDETAMDNNGTDWWPLGRIKTVAEEYPHALRNPTVAANPGKFLPGSRSWSERGAPQRMRPVAFVCLISRDPGRDRRRRRDRDPGRHRGRDHAPVLRRRTRSLRRC